MCVYAVCWFVVGLPLMYMINAVSDMLSAQLDATGQLVVSTLIFGFEIHPIIAMIGWFIYGLMHSAKRSNDLIRDYA